MSSDVMSSEVSNQSVPVLPKLGYSIKEAVAITGVGRTTLWKAIDEGKLKCFKVGRRRLFSIQHLEDFLELYESGSTSQSANASRGRAARSGRR